MKAKRAGEGPKRGINSRVVAIIGSLAAGKDELVNYLVQRHQAMALEIGAFARQLEKDAHENQPSVHYDVSAKNLGDGGSEYVIRQLVEEILENETYRTAPLIITGIRTPAEVTVLKNHLGSDLLLVFVKVGDQQARYQRIQKRELATDPTDFHTFAQRDELRKSEYALEATAALADIQLWNNDTLEAYYQQIEEKIVPHFTGGSPP